jgi:arylsulfatase A-like enzyme
MSLSTVTTPLLRGVTAGVLFALVENVFAVSTGYGVPLSSLLLALGVDFLVGVLFGGAAILWSRRNPSARAAFLFLSFATFGLTQFDHVRDAAERRGPVLVLGLLALSLLVLIALVARGKLLGSLGRSGRPELLLAVALLLFDALLVGSRVVKNALQVSYVSVASLAANGALALLALLLFQLASALSERVPTRFGGSPARVTLFATGLALAVSGVSWVAWRPRDAPLLSPPPVVRARGPSIVLVSLDTLRADHLSCYGYQRRTTPRLDAFARNAVLYRNAFTPAPWTLPAHVSILSGESPRRHGADLVEHGLRPIPEETPLLAEILRKAGYRTGAVVANSFVLRKMLGFDRGFDSYDDRPRRLFVYQPVAQELLRWLAPLAHDRLRKQTRPAAEILEEALGWIDAGGGSPFFLFVSLMEPHPPWAPPAPYQDLFPGRSARMLLPDPETLDRIQRGGGTVDERTRRHVVALYDGAVASMDDALGGFLDALAARRVLDGALVIVTADHGEFFGEHGRWGHGSGPWEDVYRVPLVVKFPGAAPPRGTRDEWVDITRIFSTVLDAAGLSLPPGGIAGLREVRTGPIATEQPLGPPTVDILDRPFRLIREEPWKLVVFEDGVRELYDLRNDPGEVHELSKEMPDRVRDLEGRLETWKASIHPRSETPENRARDKELLAKLMALGYLR